MEYRGEKNPIPGSPDMDMQGLREAIVMVRVLEERQVQLRQVIDRLDTQINSDDGIKARLHETRIISAERYKNAIRRQNCGYVIAGALIVGIITWVTVQFGQMRDRDLLRQQLIPPTQHVPLPNTIKP